MPAWTFLSNHGQVLLCIARDPDVRLREIGDQVGITERAAHQIVRQLADVLGFRTSNLFDVSVPPRVAQPVADISGGRAAAEAQRETDRWLDESGSVAFELLAEALAFDKRPRA